MLAFSNESDFACNVEIIDEKDVNKIPGMPSPDGKGTLSVKRGIEVGHIFQLGDKYSKSLNLKVQSNNSMSFLQMGCYGIGVSRIVAASIEQSHDDNGIIFPKELAPFDITLILINKTKSDSVNQKAEFLYDNLTELGIEILLDDRDCSPGIKFSDADLIGCSLSNQHQKILFPENNLYRLKEFQYLTPLNYHIKILLFDLQNQISFY